MTENTTGAGGNKPGAGVPGPEGSAGAERGDAPANNAIEEVKAQHEILAERRGMWGKGSGDTSGYGRIVRTVDMPQPSAPPYGSYFDEIVDRINEIAPDAIEQVIADRGELTLIVNRVQLPNLVKVLRDDSRLRFEHCASVSGVHYPADEGNELHSIYHLSSLTHNRRVRLEVSCPDNDPHIPSVVPVYPAADWHERETWDMFGIIYDGHPALTRILMPDDWPGHPQRKDYPLGGVRVEYKGATIEPPDQRRSY